MNVKNYVLFFLFTHLLSNPFAAAIQLGEVPNSTGYKALVPYFRPGFHFGSPVNNAGWLNDSRARDLIKREFTMLTLPVYFGIETKQGVFNFTNADPVYQFAIENRLVTRGHPLIWGLQSALPEWILKKQYTGSVKDVLIHHVRTIVNKYKPVDESQRVMVAWDVVNEPIDDFGNLRPNVWQGVGTAGDPADYYIELAFKTARAADPGAKLYLNEYGIEGRTAKFEGLIALVKRLQSRGTPIDGIGFQCHFFDLRGPGYKDLRNNIRRVKMELGLDVMITELDASYPIVAVGPRIGSVLNSNSTITSTLTWGSIEPTNVLGFRFGTDPTFKSDTRFIADQPNLTSIHSVQLPGLKPNTKYYYHYSYELIVGEKPRPWMTTTRSGNFTTPSRSTPPPVLPTEQEISSRKALFSRDQAVLYADAVRACMSESNCKAIITWGLQDVPVTTIDWLRGQSPLAFDVAFNPKPAHQAVLCAIQTAQLIPMRRAYNPHAGLHLFTTNEYEFATRVVEGYRPEGTGEDHHAFYVDPSRKKGAEPLYRLYNPHGGQHYFTLSVGERNALVKLGWHFEGTEGFIYSKPGKGRPEIFHLYNGRDHLFTIQTSERDALVKLGWIVQNKDSFGNGAFGFAPPQCQD